MILSSSDILRVLGADAIIRQEAKLAVVEERPGLGTDDTVYIYIDKYPTVEEFEATWRIWVQDNSGMGKYVLDAMTSLLPNFDFKGEYYTTTDFASERTVVKSQEEIDREEFQDRFSGLQKGLEDRLSTVRDGRDGKDGKDGIDGLPGRDGRDGVDGRDGRDGKDLVATEAELFDLQDVEQGIQMERGQVLTWDGSKWTNLYVRQTMSAGGAAGGDGGSEPDEGLGGIINSFWKFSDKEDESYEDGKFRVNSHQGKTDWSLTTEIYIAYKNNEGSNVKNYLLQLIKPGQYLYIQRDSRPDAFAMFLVDAVPVDADPKGARIEVTFVTQGPEISDITKDKLCGITFALISGDGGGGGSTTLAGLSDTNTTGATEGDLLVYRSGIWTSEVAPATGLQPGDNVSELVNDAGYITAAEVPDPVQSLNDLTDVTIDPALLDKDFGLVYDGSEWVVASPPVLIEGHNQTGATLAKGTPVYVAGTHSSGKPLLVAADADGAGTYPAIGLLHEDVANGIDGHVMLSGIIANVDTSAYSAGDALYLSTTPGVLTNVRPVAATEKVQKVGLVTRTHATAGSILIIGAGRTNDINNELVALIGAGDKDAVDLGVFAGDTISDNTDIKTALGELEAVVDTALQPGDNVSELVNDAGYITSAEAPVQSVAGKTGAVVLVKADITDFNEADYATAAQGTLADTALQSGDNISELVNDAGYLTSIPGTLFTGRYRYESNTALTPGASVVRFNSTTYASVTQIAFSKIDRDGRDTNEFLNDIVQPGFTVYFEQQNDPTRSVKFEITSFDSNNPGNVIWNVQLVSDTGVSLQTNNDVVTQFESAPVATGIEEAPQDGNYYVRQNGAWVNLQTALDAMGLTVDGGTAS